MLNLVNYTILRNGLITAFCMAAMFAFSSCNDDPSGPPDGQEASMEGLDIDDDFDFSTLAAVNVDISVRDHSDNPVPGVLVSTFKNPFVDNGLTGDALFKGITDNNGRFSVEYMMPGYIDRLYAHVDMVGFINRAEVDIIGGSAAHLFGGSPEGAPGRTIRSEHARTDLNHFPDPVPTDVNMSIILFRINGIVVTEGAEVACVTPDGYVGGAVALEEEAPWGMAVWGDDRFSDERDGFLNGEPLRFIYWDPVRQIEIDATASIIEGSGLVYVSNGFLVLGLLVDTPDNYLYMGSWDASGKPDYLEERDQRFNTDFVRRIAINLPDRVNIAQTHPNFISQEAVSSIALTDSTEVWVSFIHEGSDSRNSLGYFTFPTDRQPQSPDEIDSHTIIFPNASFSGDGGGLSIGNRVRLGRFAPNTSIGWFLVFDGWDGQMVGDDREVRYSTSNINPEIDNLKRYNILLYDEQSAHVVLAFESGFRDNPGTDHDFNDVVFAVTVSPVAALDMNNLSVMETEFPDRDGDGVADARDDYPADGDKAFDNYFPSSESTGCIVFEDQWTLTDDYDFNDLVVNYRFNQVTHSDGAISQVIGDFGIQAVGSTLHNGFGFQMPIEPGRVTSVSGIEVGGGYINLAGNNLEASQSQAVVIVFDDALSIVRPAVGFSYVNTEPGSPHVDSDRITVTIDFGDPVDPTEFGTPPHNPFIIIDRGRSREVHLAGHPPTDLADLEAFGEGDDTSDPASGRYYKSRTNLPWALLMPAGWRHVNEAAEIVTAYPNFAPWAESSGSELQDWFINLPGNTVENHIWTGR